MESIYYSAGLFFFLNFGDANEDYRARFLL